jgi:hypothetical protein
MHNNCIIVPVSDEIPYPLIAVVAEVFSKQYTHTEINSRFYYANFPPEPPDGNKQEKCHDWLRRGNRELPQPLGALGKLLEELMESVPPTEWWDGESPHPSVAHRERINRQLEALGLAYKPGGHIVSLGAASVSETIEEIARAWDMKGVQAELKRIAANVDSDPPSAVTASCALLEALFKAYLSNEDVSLPSDQSILPLWKAVRDRLNLNPAVMQNESLRKILSGLASIVDGVASLRSNHGSAHGHDPKRRGFKIEARHARLAAGAAATLASFVMEVHETVVSKMQT